jgi:lipopolysaccharide export system permease protein
MLSTSWIVVLAVPIGVLFATLMAFGALSSTHEVAVMKASGMGLIRMMVPLIVIAGMLWGGVYWYTDNVLPDTNLRLSAMMRDIKRLKPSFAVDKGKFSTQIEGFTILARDVDTTGLMRGVTIYDRSRGDRVNIVSADSGRLAFSPSLTKLVLQLYQGEVHQSQSRNPNDYRIVRFTRHQIAMQADRFFYEETDVSGSSRGDREMSSWDMWAIVRTADSNIAVAEHRLDSMITDHMAYLYRSDGQVDTTVPAKVRASSLVANTRSKLEGESYRRNSEHNTSNKYAVEAHKKYAIPFACFLFVFVGAPLGILTKGGNFGMSAAIALGCYVLYWMTLIGGEKLADRNFLDPAIAMWLGNAIFIGIGAFATYRVNAR